MRNIWSGKRKTGNKETLHKARLTALHAICVQIFVRYCLNFSCITPPASGILKVYRSPEPAAVTSFRTGAIIMEIKKKNSNIHCSVTQCKHNMVTENYCGLDCICVGTHESNPTVPECTNCDSFVKRCGTEC